MRRKPLAKKPARARARDGNLLANKKLPAVENRHHVERGRSITYELRPVLCGKPNCLRHHGPYWYAYWTEGGRVRTAYIGKTFRKVSDKAPERLRAGEEW